MASKEILLKHGSKIENFSHCRRQAQDHILLVAGGPGLGKESFQGLETIFPDMNLSVFQPFEPDPTQWLNETAGNDVIQKWSVDLLQAVRDLGPSALLGHSFGGMFLQNLPDLQEWSKPIFLVSTAPNLSYKECYGRAYDQLLSDQLKTIDDALEKYRSLQSSSNLQSLFLAWGPFFFDSQHQTQGRLFLSRCTYYPGVYEVGSKYFLNKFATTWERYRSNVCIISGKNDSITPLSLFEDLLFKDCPKFEIANSGHFPWIDTPSEFQRVVKSLL